MAYDNVHNPKHYNINGIEAIDVIQSRLTPEEYLGYLKGSKLKYDLRWAFKGNPAEDLNKSGWYQEKILEVLMDEDAINPPQLEAMLDRSLED